MSADLPLRYHSEPLTAAQQQQLLDLYQQAIDPREQKPRATLAAALARGDYRWQVACRGDELLAFALLWDDGEVALLEYLARLDAKKYTVMVQQFYNRPNCPPVFIVIEKNR